MHIFRISQHVHYERTSRRVPVPQFGAFTKQKPCDFLIAVYQRVMGILKQENPVERCNDLKHCSMIIS